VRWTGENRRESTRSSPPTTTPTTEATCSQLSRPQERVKAYTPGIFDLRDSGAIEADADQIIFVYREREPGNKTPREEGAFIVAKARMGRTGMQSFVFDGATQQFEMKAVAEERAAIQGWSVYQGGGEP